MSSNLRQHLNKLLVICEIHSFHEKTTLRRAILRQFSQDKTFCKTIVILYCILRERHVFPLVNGNNCQLHSRFHGMIHFRDKQLITSFQKFNGQDGGNLPIK